MNGWLKLIIVASVGLAVGGVGAGAWAQDVGAVSSGNWNTGSIWTSGTVPGSSNNVYIGSTYPSGSAATATVTLTQNQAAQNVYLGYGAGTSGTLNLGNNTLTISGGLTIGQSGGIGILQEGSGGSFTAYSLSIDGGNSLTMGSNDTVKTMYLTNGATATTTTAGNVTIIANVSSGSTLNLGADTSLSSELVVADQGSVLNMNGHALSVYEGFLGDTGTSPVTVENQGNIAATYLYVGNGMTYNLLAGDKITNFELDHATSTLNGAVTNLLQYGASAATVAETPMTLSSVSLDQGSTLTLHGGDVISSVISLTNSSLLTVRETNGTGLTYQGVSPTITSSHIDLDFTATGWDFRWADPSSGGNWVSTIDGMISSGQIILSLPPGGQYQVVDQGGYTYIDGIVTASVPEPSTLVLGGIGVASAGAIIMRKRRRS
jgi:hypothetical protein